MSEQPELPMQTMMNHEKILQNEMGMARIIAERDQFILMLLATTKSQTNQIAELEKINAKLKEGKE